MGEISWTHKTTHQTTYSTIILLSVRLSKRKLRSVSAQVKSNHILELKRINTVLLSSDKSNKCAITVSSYIVIKSMICAKWDTLYNRFVLCYTTPCCRFKEMNDMPRINGNRLSTNQGTISLTDFHIQNASFSSVDHKLKGNHSQLIVEMLSDVLRPGVAGDLDEYSVNGIIKSDHDKWRTEAFLVQVRKEVARPSFGRPVRYVTDVLVVSGVLKMNRETRRRTFGKNCHNERFFSYPNINDKMKPKANE